MEVDSLTTSPLSGIYRLRQMGVSTAAATPLHGGADAERRTPTSHPAALSTSQELDSGVGRTDESTRYEESSEHDLLADDHTSACNTNATTTPASLRKFRPAGLGLVLSLYLPSAVQMSLSSPSTLSTLVPSILQSPGPSSCLHRQALALCLSCTLFPLVTFGSLPDRLFFSTVGCGFL